MAHWSVFAIMISNGFSQWLSNFVAFCIAVSISFFANAKWTFERDATTIRYMMYVFFMGAMASLIGWVADKTSMPPIATLVCFSLISLICGFIYSKYVVFKDEK
ncbi:GtrA family protein [Serratia inhibens]|uniref:GtrA family protein n=1 Tax=Serratia inhibens TaxID=2338073 RepID=UPI003217485B